MLSLLLAVPLAVATPPAAACDAAPWRALVREHARRYPVSSPEDLYKLVHQATQGSEHAVSSAVAAERWMSDEIATMGPGPDEPVVDPLGRASPFVRIHLRPFVDRNGDPLALTRAFVETANGAVSERVPIECALEAVAGASRSGGVRFDADEWSRFVEDRRARAFDASHHSPDYERAYRPAYRVVARSELPDLGLRDPADRRRTRSAIAAAGFAAAFVGHEAAHLAFDLAFDADPDLHRIDFGPIPFVAVGHRPGLPAREEALISAAGFLSQHAASELVLSRRPRLRAEPASFAKGLLVFHAVTSAGYAVAAFARAGAVERDTRSIAAATGWSEPAIGALVLAPAAFDAWRFFRPDSRAARFASRASKALFLGVVLFAPR